MVDWLPGDLLSRVTGWLEEADENGLVATRGPGPVRYFMAAHDNPVSEDTFRARLKAVQVWGKHVSLASSQQNRSALRFASQKRP